MTDKTTPVADEKKWYNINVTPSLNWLGVILSLFSIFCAWATLIGKMNYQWFVYTVIVVSVVGLLVPYAFLRDDAKKNAALSIFILVIGVLMVAQILWMLPSTSPVAN